jgi:DNA-binding transcriptional regulator YiaG
LGIAQRRIRIAYDQASTQRKPCKPLPASIKTLGDWIKIKRHQKNLTASHLAAKMGIATPLVQAWETGTCQPDDGQRQMLCSIFDC